MTGPHPSSFKLKRKADSAAARPIADGDTARVHNTKHFEHALFAAYSHVSRVARGPFAFIVHWNYLREAYDLMWAAGQPVRHDPATPVTMLLHEALTSGAPYLNKMTIYIGGGYIVSDACAGMAEFAEVNIAPIAGHAYSGNTMRFMRENMISLISPVDSLNFTDHRVVELGEGPFVRSGDDLYTVHHHGAHKINMLFCFAAVRKRIVSPGGRTGGANIGAAVFSRTGRFLAWGLNTNRYHSLCHAETNVMTSLIRRDDFHTLNDLIIYTTLKPCRMCAGYIAHCLDGRRYKVIYAVNDPSNDAKNTILDNMQGVQYLLDDIKPLITRPALDARGEIERDIQRQHFRYHDGGGSSPSASSMSSPSTTVSRPSLGVLANSLGLLAASQASATSSSSSSSTAVNPMGSVALPQGRFGQFPKYSGHRPGDWETDPKQRPPSPIRASISYQSYRLQYEAEAYMVMFLATKSGLRLIDVAVHTLARLCSKYRNKREIASNNPLIRFNPHVEMAIAYLADVFLLQGVPFPQPIYQPTNSATAAVASASSFSAPIFPSSSASTDWKREGPKEE